MINIWHVFFWYIHSWVWADPFHPLAVGSLNNDRTVMSRPFAWRPLACLPILKTSAFTNTSTEWQVYHIVYIFVYHKLYNKIHCRDNADCLCTTAHWAISCQRSMKSAQQNSTIDLQTSWFGKGVGFGTCWAWMGLRLLWLLCVMSTTALRVIAPSQNWTILKHYMRWDRSVNWKEKYMLHEQNF